MKDKLGLIHIFKIMRLINHLILIAKMCISIFKNPALLFAFFCIIVYIKTPFSKTEVLCYMTFTRNLHFTRM